MKAGGVDDELDRLALARAGVAIDPGDERGRRLVRLGRVVALLPQPART